MRRLRPNVHRARQRELPTAFEPIAVPSDDEELVLDDGPDAVEAMPVPVTITPPAYAPTADEPDRAAASESVAADAPAEPAPQRRRRLRLTRAHVAGPARPWTLDWRALLLALALIGGGIVGTLLVQERLREDLRGDLRAWWPATFAALSLVWMLSALLRRQAASFLGGAALGGVALSLLLDMREIANARDTLLGVVLIALGVGIVIRGLLLRQRVPYRS